MKQEKSFNDLGDDYHEISEAEFKENEFALETITDQLAEQDFDKQIEITKNIFQDKEQFFEMLKSIAIDCVASGDINALDANLFAIELTETADEIKKECREMAVTEAAGLQKNELKLRGWQHCTSPAKYKYPETKILSWVNRQKDRIKVIEKEEQAILKANMDLADKLEYFEGDFATKTSGTEYLKRVKIK